MEEQKLAEQTTWAEDAYIEHYVGMIRDGLNLLRLKIIGANIECSKYLALNLKIQMKDFRFLIQDICDEPMTYQKICQKFNAWEKSLDEMIDQLAVLVKDRAEYNELFNAK